MKFLFLSHLLFGNIIAFLNREKFYWMIKSIRCSLFGNFKRRMSNIKFLNQKEAIQVDVELMSEKHGFSIDQLMEMAGMSISEVVSKTYSEKTHPKILIVCGPGNNGGDGLVAARHLSHYGYKPHIVYPKKTENKLYLNLILQCKNLDINITHNLPESYEKEFHLILDSIFGFSFSGKIREPFDKIIQVINQKLIVKSISSSNLPIVSVDIPSGW